MCRLPADDIVTDVTYGCLRPARHRGADTHPLKALTKYSRITTTFQIDNDELPLGGVPSDQVLGRNEKLFLTIDDENCDTFDIFVQIISCNFTKNEADILTALNKNPCQSNVDRVYYIITWHP